MMDSIEIYDIYDMWYTPSWWEKKITWLALGAVVLGFCLLFLFLFLRKRRAQKKLTVVQKALHTIASLENQKNILSHQVLYGILTTALKEFLCHYYGKHYASQTDYEILTSLNSNKHQLPDDVIQDIMFVFKGVEMIKFSNQKAFIAKRDEDLIRSKHIIEKINLKSLNVDSIR